MDNNEHKYDDMLKMPHHISTKHKPMPIQDRAAQFGAFRALSGYEEAIAETGRLTHERIELDECAKEELDAKLTEIRDSIDSMPVAAVTYYVPDEKKQGGAYVTEKAAVLRVMEYERKLVIKGDTEIPIDEIIAIEIEADL